MTRRDDCRKTLSNLRERAETLLGKRRSEPEDVTVLSPMKVQQLVHELRVHQIELEMQNEDLQRAQVLLSESRDRYSDLYDFAPVGYFTIDEKGQILETNLSGADLFGVERKRLIKTGFSRFIAPDFQDVFYLHRQHVFETQTKQTCELKLLQRGGPPFYAHVESIAMEGGQNNRRQMQTVVINITARKAAEEALTEARDELERRVRERTLELVTANVLLEAINRLFQESWSCDTTHALAQAFLRGALKLAGCQAGFVAEGNESALIDFMALTDAGGHSRIMSGSEAKAKLQDLEVWELWGRVIREGQSLIVKKPVSQPGLPRNPDDGEKVASFLGVPLQYAGKVLGMIGLANKEEGFDLGDQKALESLGMAFVEILNHKRSEELVHALSQELLKAQEVERKRLSFDLHDSLAQDLAALKIGLDMLLEEQEEIPVERRQRVAELSKMVQRDIMVVRNMAYDLHPAGLRELGLVQTVRLYCEDFSIRTGRQVEFFSVGLDAVELDSDSEIALYRLIQESLTNIQKHTDTGQVTIRLTASFPHITLRIEDQGKGFDVEKRLVAALGEKRMGLWSMQQRVAHLKGELKIESHPAQGTTIMVRFPCEETSHG
jgi:PAS domain S-box-containing protein